MDCKKCGRNYKEKYLHRHHILPYSIFKTYDCPTIILCKWCHKKLHNDLELLGFVTKEKIEKFTEEWLKGNLLKKEHEEIFPLCPKCKKKENRLFFHRQGKDYLILICLICGYKSPPDKEAYILWNKKRRRENSIQYKKMRGWIN